MARPQTHLAQITEEYGSGDATADLREILRSGLVALEERKRQQRIAERGDGDKHNPFVSDAGKCFRQVVYSLMNAEMTNPPTEDALMNFLVGHCVEEAWAEILTAAGAEYVREERVRIPAGDTFVTGRKDFTSGTLLRWRDAITELKSTNSRAMGWMLKKGEHGKDEHRRQLNLYLYHDDLPAGYLVYLVKDTTKGEPILHAFRVEIDREQAENDIATMTEADKLAKRGELPPIPEEYAKRPNFPCSYCSWSTQCLSDHNTELDRQRRTPNGLR